MRYERTNKTHLNEYQDKFKIYRYKHFNNRGDIFNSKHSSSSQNRQDSYH